MGDTGVMRHIQSLIDDAKCFETVRAYTGQTVPVVQAVIVLRLLSKGATTPNPSGSATCASPASDALTI